MKKSFLLLIISSITCMGYAQTSGTLSGMSIHDFIEVLDNVKGYFFIGKGEARDLSLTLEREPNNDIKSANQAQDMDWYSYNDAIVSVDDKGLISGNAYGETILSTVNNNVAENYVVFVCPVITIVSPEGAIYSYHKIFNQSSRVQFTASEHWEINCVTRDGEIISESYIDEQGWYESDTPIDSDVRFHVTMESRNNNLGNVKVTVNGQNVTIHADSSVLTRTIIVKDMWGNELYKGAWPAEGTLEFLSDNRGIFTIHIPGDDQQENVYKIIIE